MASETMATTSEKIYVRVAHARAITDLLANCKPEHLLNETLTNAAESLRFILDDIDELASGAA